MDYCFETLNFHHEMTRELNDVMFVQMEKESEFIISSLENMMVVVNEAVQDSQKKRNIFQRIIEFIKRIFQTFMNKVKSLFTTNKKWLEENASKLEKLNYDGLEVTIVPFWTYNDIKAKEVDNITKNTIRALINNPGEAEKYKDLEDMKQKLFNKYLDENGDLANGLKNFYRTGNSKSVKPVTLKNNELKNKIIQDFIPYCNNYQARTKVINDLIREVENEIKLVENMINKKSVNEAYCLIEECYLNETELVYCANYIVTEAENRPAKEENKPSQQNSNQDKTSPTKVEVKDFGNKETLERKDEYDKMNSKELTLLKNLLQIKQTNIAALMTVMEERYSVYIKTMKQILSARNNKPAEQK
jgi:hypothetical protein